MPEQIQDGVEQVWNSFFALRTRKLDERFLGEYRAVVVETNDPLQMHRVRVRIPELHNHDLKPEHCPWAVMSPWAGGSGCGSWTSPIKDDLVWVVFEKGHPYSIIITGSADPTRRKFYSLESIYGKTPTPVDKNGDKTKKRDDYLEDYLPKDNRPMSMGWKDRYGSFMILNSTGFFPKEHDEKSSPVGQDAVSKGKFDASEKKPEKNDPDLKYVATCTKYGNFMIFSDVGYDWKKDGDNGEFDGDFDKDEDFEIKRSKYLQKLFTEGKPKDLDQRRVEFRTRYGHKIEMRDVGWGSKDGSTRTDEYDSKRRKIAKEDKPNDQRWLKFRTKGGHLIQLWDFGCDPVDDEFVKRKLLDEVGATDHEDDWQDRGDGRQIRFVTRYGFKIALDDRGSDKKDATGKATPIGNGLFIKGRRPMPPPPPPADGSPAPASDDTTRGFGIEFNEKDQLNRMLLYSPASKILELNDRLGYVMLCTDTNKPISRPWKNLSDNEFATAVAMTFDPEADTHHLKLDKTNGYVRLITAAQQGVEMRDGVKPGDKVWVELRDVEDRGFWMSKTDARSVIRASEQREMYIIFDERSNDLLIHNASGRIQIYGSGPIEVKSDSDIKLHGRSITLKADTQIGLEAGGAHAVLQPGAFGTDVDAHHPKVLGYLPGAKPGPGAQSASPMSSSVPSVATQAPGKVRPLPFDIDRGKISQTKPIEEIDEKIIWGQA